MVNYIIPIMQICSFLLFPGCEEIPEAASECQRPEMADENSASLLARVCSLSAEAFLHPVSPLEIGGQLCDLRVHHCNFLVIRVTPGQHP